MNKPGIILWVAFALLYAFPTPLLPRAQPILHGSSMFENSIEFHSAFERKSWELATSGQTDLLALFLAEAPYMDAAGLQLAHSKLEEIIRKVSSTKLQRASARRQISYLSALLRRNLLSSYDSLATVADVFRNGRYN